MTQNGVAIRSVSNSSAKILNRRKIVMHMPTISVFFKCLQLDGLQCNVPVEQVTYMKGLYENCNPIVECEVLDPYKKSSILAENQCFKVCPFI